MGYPKAVSIVIFMNVEMNRLIGRCLQELRTEKSLTQIEVATRLGKPQSYVSKIETGERNLYLSELFSYAGALEMDARGLVGSLENKIYAAGHPNLYH